MTKPSPSVRTIPSLPHRLMIRMAVSTVVPARSAISWRVEREGKSAPRPSRSPPTPTRSRKRLRDARLDRAGHLGDPLPELDLAVHHQLQELAEDLGVPVGEGEELPLGDVDDRRRLDGDRGARVGTSLPGGDDPDGAPGADDPEDDAPRRRRLDDLHGAEGDERHLRRAGPLDEDRVAPLADLEAADLGQSPRLGRVQAAEQGDPFEKGERHDSAETRIPARRGRSPCGGGRAGNIPAP